MQRVEIMSANHHMVDVNIEKVNTVTQIVEFLPMIASLLLVTITLPFCLFKVVYKYERAVVFRIDRLKSVHGPGKSSVSFRRLM